MKILTTFVSSLGVAALFPVIAAAVAPTTTSLTAGPSDTVAVGTVLTLTATVTSNGHPVTKGLVKICTVGSLLQCKGAGILGEAWLTSGGTAKVRLRLAIGGHGIKAVFRGTTLLAASQSTGKTVSVTGLYPTSTTVSGLGFGGAYQVTGTVTASGPPSGCCFLTFLNQGSLFAEGGSGAPKYSFLAQGTFPVEASVAGDFNNDGLPDVLASPAGQ